MNKSSNPLRLNVGYFYNKSIGTSREVPVGADRITIEDLSVRNLESLVRISRTREGLLLQVRAEAEIKTTCVRCLDVFYLPVDIEFEELYQFPSRYREETDMVLPEDGYIDLSSLYREYLILAMPIRHLCQPECKGLCSICGANLNEILCEHHQEDETHTESLIDEEAA